MSHSAEKGSIEWWEYWKSALEQGQLSAQCHIELTRISQLRYNSQTFYAKFVLTLRLPLKAIEHEPQVAGFDPMITLLNSYKDVVVEQSEWESGENHKFFYNVEGTFEDEYEMEKFPFDVQKIILNISTAWDTRYLVLERDEQRNSEINVQANKTIASLYNIAPTLKLESRIAISSRELGFSQLEAKAIIRRYWAPHVATVWLRQLVTVTLAFSSFAIPLNGSPSRDRLTVVVGLLLISTLSFQKEEGPLTWLDSYVVVSFLTLALIMVYHGIGVALTISLEVDYFAIGIFTALWIGINLVFLCKAITYVREGKKEVASWANKA